MEAQNLTTLESVSKYQQKPQKKFKKRFGKQFIVDLLKLARPRTWFFIYYSYVIGWLLSGAHISLQFIIGFLICVLSTANVNLLNAYTDIEEDQINLPNRVIMIDRVGLVNLRNIVILIYAVTSIMAVIMPFWFQVVFLLSVFDTAFYSLEPLRFKAKPIQSMISFSGAVFLPGVASWTLTNDLMKIPPIIYFLGYMFLTYCTLKNLPDARARSGYPSQNIMLAASALGLGTCAIGGFNREAIIKILEIPDNLEPILLITVGYPNETPKPKPHQPLTEVAFLNSCNNPWREINE
jgi:hypothetical protein